MIKPHLACDADSEFRFIKYPSLVMPKIDGVRGINLGELTGRTMKTFANYYTTRIFSHHALRGFDGELAAGSLTDLDLCRKTTSAINTQTGTPTITWNIFDFINDDTYMLPYGKRFAVAQKKVEILHTEYPQFKHLVNVVPAFQVHSQTEIEEYLQKFLDEGYEGIIIRSANGLHKDGRCTAREAAYLRIKDFVSEEAEVIDIYEAQENQNEAKINALGFTERSSHKENKVGKGMLGGLICYNEKWGTFKVGPGKMDHSDRVAYWYEPSAIIGQTITYKRLKTGTKDKPRMPTFQHIRATQDIL
jgi:hypothetical protein